MDTIRADFPILQQKVYDKPYVYLDNGATTQKPKVVIEAVKNFYEQTNSNIHRGVHLLSEKSTEQYEQARNTVAEFIHANSSNEIIFTKGTTDSINLVAFSFGEKYIAANDEIIVSEMEHHSNIVPWQMLCDRKQAKLKVLPFDDNGELCVEQLDELISERTKLIALTHVSNSLGTVNPIAEIVKIAHAKGVKVLVDGAQAIQHTTIDVQALDCDFYVFSGHKIYAETGIGVLYGKEDLLNEMPPYQGGGDMIKEVTFEKTTYSDLPLKFEAGTNNYVAAISLGEAIKYVQAIGMKAIAAHENELMQYASHKLGTIDGLRIYGTAANKVSVISFLVNNIHHYDMGMMLDKMGIAVRTGSHCTQPVMAHFDITGTVRASFAFYNTKEEIDRLYDGIIRIKKIFA